MAFTHVYIASDHGGFALKQAIVEQLAKVGVAVEDLGPACAESCDYPIFARRACTRVLSTPGAAGILVCGTGLGMSMAANRLPGIRAALCYNEFAARMARAHNDANILCLGERVMGSGLASGVVQAFLGTEFEGDRHARRIRMIDDPDAAVPGEAP